MGRRENARAKGMRYLTEGRLTVLRIDSERVEADCKGGGAIYRVGWHDGRWTCNCPALSTCAHLHALQSVTVREVGQT